jgi:hemolysin D
MSITKQRQLRFAIVFSIVANITLVSCDRNNLVKYAEYFVETQVPVLGKLEPISPVYDVNVPLGMRVQKVLVKDGETVTPGKILLTVRSNRGSDTDIRTPVVGTVFDSQVSDGTSVVGVLNPVMRIVPDSNLQAVVFITAKDVNSVRNAIGGKDRVSIRLDTYPFSEFGEIKGTLESVSSEAIPPDPTHPFTRFKAIVRLSKQTMTVRGIERQLESGMSLNANIAVTCPPANSNCLTSP